MKCLIRAILLLSAVFLIGCSKVVSPSANTVMTPDTKAGPADSDRFISIQNAAPAPQLASGRSINSRQIDLAALHGRVVLLDFWTFLCSNCINTLPTLKRLDSKYRGDRLTIVGIETPELEAERSFDNLQNAVKAREIEYPVITDYDSADWTAYGIDAWPTVVIIDKAGRIRYRHVGEGAYEEEENVIRALLTEPTN